MAAAHGQPYAETLTGFKWISRVDGLAFGYEEALGYCVDPEHVKDKDGVSALLLLCELAAEQKARGRGLTDVLDDIAAEHGLHATDQLSIRVDDLSLIGAAMARLRDNPPTSLGGLAVDSVDDLSLGSADLPPTDGLRYRLAEGARVIVRPSGTEPKLKCYLEVVIPVHPDDGVDAARIAARRPSRRHQGRREARPRHLTAPIRLHVNTAEVTAIRRRIGSGWLRARIETTNPTAVTTRPAISGQAQRRRTAGSLTRAGPAAGAVGQVQDPVPDVLGVGELGLSVAAGAGADGPEERVADGRRDVALLVRADRQHLPHHDLVDRGERDDVGVDHVAQEQGAGLDADGGAQQGGVRDHRGEGRAPGDRRTEPALAVEDRVDAERHGQADGQHAHHASAGRWELLRVPRLGAAGTRVLAHHPPLCLISPVVVAQPYAGSGDELPHHR